MITDQKINFCLLCSFVKHKNVSRLVLKFCFTFQSMDSCVLCKEELRSEYVTVGQKGRQTLVTASLQREDGLDKLLETIDPLRIHSFCQKNYTCESSIYAEKRKHDDDSSTGLASANKQI